MAAGGSEGLYSVEVRPAVRRDLKRIPRDILARIDSRIRSLAEDPSPVGAIKLTNEDNLYRIRVGDYRIIYQKDDEARRILIARVRHRRDAYR